MGRMSSTSTGFGQLAFFKNLHLRLCVLILEREKHGCERKPSTLLPLRALTMDETLKLGMCLDQISNTKPFGVRDGAETI